MCSSEGFQKKYSKDKCHAHTLYTVHHMSFWPRANLTLAFSQLATRRQFCPVICLVCCYAPALPELRLSMFNESGQPGTTSSMQPVSVQLSREVL